MKNNVKLILLLSFINFSIVAQIETKKTAQPPVNNNVNKPVTNNNSSQLFLFAQTMPSFPGGEAKLREYIIKNFNYPDYERTHGISGTSNVSFVVEKDGSLTDIKVVKGVPKGSGCDAEGIRLVKQMPKWKPGIQGGKPVRVQMSLPIIFTIQKPATPAASKPKQTPKTNNGVK